MAVRVVWPFGVATPGSRQHAGRTVTQDALGEREHRGVALQDGGSYSR